MSYEEQLMSKSKYPKYPQISAHGIIVMYELKVILKQHYHIISAQFLGELKYILAYCMASSASGQDDPNRGVIGYPSGQEWSHLARSGLPAYPARKISPKAI